MDRLNISDEGLIESFAEDCKLRNMTKETIRGYRGQLRIFDSIIKRKKSDLLHIDRDILRNFIQYLRDERKNSQKRVENYLSALSTFYDYMVYERLMSSNPVLEVRKRYLRNYKTDASQQQRKLISVEEMAMLIGSIMDPRDKAIAALLAKTGIRRGELIRMDLDDISWEDLSITLKPTPKRSNRVVFFDDECGRILKRWLRLREELQIDEKCTAVFTGAPGNRLKRNGVYSAIIKWATIAGIHDPKSDKMEDHFMPHCFRHWFTTHLLRNRMPREYVKELRGDARNEAIDIYHHIDREELRRAYLAHIPQLGIE